MLRMAKRYTVEMQPLGKVDCFLSSRTATGENTDMIDVGCPCIVFFPACMSELAVSVAVECDIVPLYFVFKEVLCI
jgi:hypothetical protein